MGQEALEAAIKNYRNKGKDQPQKEGKVVCVCFGVTDTEIKKVVSENNLTNVEEVTNYCKAGGGCTGCHPQIEQIIEQCRPEKAQADRPATKKPEKMTNIKKYSLFSRL